MPFHFCIDELIAIMAMIPFIGIFFRKVHAWWHAKFNHPPHPNDIYLFKEDMDANRNTLKDYDFDPFERGLTVVSEEDMKYLRGEPVPLKITIPIKIDDK